LCLADWQPGPLCQEFTTRPRFGGVFVFHSSRQIAAWPDAAETKQKNGGFRVAPLCLDSSKEKHIPGDGFMVGMSYFYSIHEIFNVFDRSNIPD
jgi:hypothetical protein